MAVIGLTLSTSANENIKDILAATGTLIKDVEDQGAVDVLKNRSKDVESTVVKNKVLEIIALAMKTNGDSGLDGFKMAHNYCDFSRVDNAAEPKAVLQKQLPFLVLSLASEYEVQMGNSPTHLDVKVNGAFTPSFQEQPVFEDAAPAVITDSTQTEDALETPTKPMAAGDIKKDSVFYQAYHSAKKAQSGDSQGMKDLLKLSVEKHDEDVNRMLVKTISLAMINSGSKSLKGYFSKVDSTFGGQEYLDFLEQEPFQKNCPKCDGEGFIGVPCKKGIDGKCRNCKGKGFITYKGLDNKIIKKECPVSKGTGKCPHCDGTGIIKLDCSTCKNKGTIFDKSAVPQEYAASLQRIIDLMPKLADDQGIYIGVGINRLALARIEQEKRQKEERIRLQAEMQRRQREQELLAKQVAERKAAEAAEKEKSEGNMIVRTVEMEPIEEGGTSSRLKHALLEMTENLNAKERVSKANIYETVDAKYQKGLATLFIEVSAEVAGLDSDTRFQYIDGFFRFWKLRCGANGAGTPGFQVTYKGQLIAEAQKGTTVLLTK